MADIRNRLRIKYGLTNVPTASDQERWAKLTDALIAQAWKPEAAGREAARQLFPDFERNIYASESDTIEMLLRQAGQK